MTYRAFFLLVATLLLLEILAYFLGQEVKLWAIVAIGIFGMLGIWQREKLIASVTAYWHALSPEGRQRALVHVEEWVDRPQVAEQGRVVERHRVSPPAASMPPKPPKPLRRESSRACGPCHFSESDF